MKIVFILIALTLFNCANQQKSDMIGRFEIVSTSTDYEVEYIDPDGECWVVESGTFNDCQRFVNNAKRGVYEY